MLAINADSIPLISITHQIDAETDTPALRFFDIEMSSNDWDLEGEGLADEVFARARLTLFDPLLGNPTDNADAHSQELYDVATAFYDPEGELSARALAKTQQDEEMASPPMLYINTIEALNGFEKGGRIEAGIALALRQIALDYGCEIMDAPLMLSVHDRHTLTLVDGADLLDPNATRSSVALGAGFKDAFRLESWVAPGQTYASEPGHGAASGLLLNEAQNKMMGYESSLHENTLLGCSRATFDFDFHRNERTDEQIDAWRAQREAAQGAPASIAPPAAAPAPLSLAESLEELSQRVSLLSTLGALSEQEIEALRKTAQDLAATLAAPKTLSDKLSARRGSPAIEIPDGAPPKAPS